MKFRIAALLLAAALSVPAATGCNKGDDNKEGAAATEKKESPKETLEKMMGQIQNGETDKVAPFFSKTVPSSIVASFLSKMKDSKEVLQFAIRKPVVEGNTATVEYLYFYQNKVKVEGGGFEAAGKRLKASNTAVMELEGGEWKIRKFDPAIDTAVERALFMQCLEQVSMAQLSEEQYYMANKSFTRSVADMGRYLKVDLDACAAIDITGVTTEGYNIKAATKNIPPCTITATRRTISPKAYSGCEKPMAKAKAPSAAAPASHTVSVTIVE